MINLQKMIKKMSISEKIGQLNLVSYREELLEPVRRGEVGAVLNIRDADAIKKLQEAALLSPHKIPLLIGDDVIHGFSTTFPVPLSEACSFNPDLMEASSFYSMLEAREAGINWIFAPMLDLTNDPRWGRIMETGGEDPYLNSIMAKSRVKGFQKEGDGRITAACAKHYLGYGAVEAGLDYATSDFSETKMRNYYLPPFKAAIEAGVMSVMSAFTTFNNLPVTMNHYLLNDVLRKECGFGGPVVSDWQAIKQLMNFKIASSEKEAANLAIEAGIDIDLHGRVYSKYLEELLIEKPELIDLIDQAVYRILNMKVQMGLFSDPFPKRNPVSTEEIRKQARKSADESIILFKNEDKILPLAKDANILVTGLFLNDRDIHLGAWSCNGRAENVVNIREGIEKRFEKADFYEILDIGKTNWEELKRQALNKDYIIVVLGEPRYLSGENNCRLSLNLPLNQEALIDFLSDLNIPLIGIISSGRPLIIENVEKKVKALLWNFHLGCEAGNSLAACLLGEVNPSAKTAVTFPKKFGQIPIYYNRYPYGRPDIVRYMDGDLDPLYPFGYGLSYSEFTYHDFNPILKGNKLFIEFEIENISEFDGKEVVQIYVIPEVIKSLVPEKQLIAFKKTNLKAKSKACINMEIDLDLSNYRSGITIMVGSSSKSVTSKYLPLQ